MSPAAAPPAPPAAERGALTVADRVVARIAAQAAREALRATGPPGAGDRMPHTEVTVGDRTARIRIVVELPYPSDIAAQCSAVRRQVTSRVRELVDMAVPEVAVTVRRLRSAALDGRRPGRVT
ncbi:Asp23/Gls24 family envelope stress response protein [Streptomyces sp. AJS327]|uniref:Asp23/Gls24 family envelope stress response protein n=1 Tax=Streptomyces sp. AJS327 TaxID=2545265 RepID=UPI0015DF8B34|nr:Asp23/Gls24 family envelope stress response protein [Streptomyces sp. AJS327]MBA0050495.1 Asp23/Gls24 family envelope stress response protein [Streptomyces sp. AJS327]